MSRYSVVCGAVLCLFAFWTSVAGDPAFAQSAPVAQRGSAGGYAPQVGVHVPGIPAVSEAAPRGMEEASGDVPLGRIEKNEAEEAAKREWLRNRGYPGTLVAPKRRVVGYESATLGGSLLESGGPESGGLGATAANLEPRAPTLGTSFQGGTQFLQIVPDCGIAAGPTSLITSTNDFVNVFSKDGTQDLTHSQSLPQFFSPLGQVASDGNGPFDPHVVFDEYIQRFWLIAVTKNPNSMPKRSTVLIALSDTSDAAGTWTEFSVGGTLNGNDDSGYWCDFPQIGIDAQAIYLTCNMFDFDGNSQYSKIRVMTKDQFLANAGLAWWDFWNLRESELGIQASFTVQPAHMYGANAANGEFLVDAHIFCVFCPPGTLEVWHMTNAQRCCDGSQNGPDLAQQDHDVGDYPDPPGARQFGTTTRLDTGDTRLLYAFWKDGLLSTVQNLGCGSDACVSYTELDVTGFPSISTVSDFAFTTSGLDFFYPAVAPNASGAKTMVFGRSASTEFAAVSYIGIPPSSTCTNCVDGPSVILQNGQNTYVDVGCPTSGCPSSSDRNRWGDFFGAAPDPDGTGIWIHGEFPSGTGTGTCGMCAPSESDSWATQVGLTYETSAGCGNGILQPPEQCDDGNQVNSDGCEADCIYTPVCQSVDAGGTVTSDISGSGATPGFPMQVSVETPTAGTVCINLQTAGAGAVPGFDVVGLQAQITAPSGSAGAPLTLVFFVDASAIPAGANPSTIPVLKNGTVVRPCIGSNGVANPDPCVAERVVLGDGDLRITVLTSTASLWTIAVPNVAGCGNGVVDAGEQCDDGNTVDGDCCSSTCQDEDLGTSTCGVGACQRTVPNCVNGVPQACIPGSPSVEGPYGTASCSNGIDDDCDGLTDRADVDCNAPPDCSHAAANPGELWPPNHHFLDASIDGVTDPDGDPVTITITGIMQDEPLQGRHGAGRTCPDAGGIGTATALLRAERIGRRDGRVYDVGFMATDGRGGACTAVVPVCVPHNRRPGHACVDQGPLFDSTGPCP